MILPSHLWPFEGYLGLSPWLPWLRDDENPLILAKIFPIALAQRLKQANLAKIFLRDFFWRLFSSSFLPRGDTSSNCS